MKKIAYALLATISGLVLLFSYRTSLGADVSVALAPADGTVASDAGSSADSGTTAGDASGSSESSGSSSAASGSALIDGVYTGDAASTRYGPVQVTVTVSGGVITAVDVPEYPDSNHRDQQINSRAIPQLVSETLSAQSASVDMVSGATYTSRGYAASLQSAIDQATR